VNCNDFRLLMNEFVDGDLPRLSQDEARVHLSECASCRDETDRIRYLVSAASSLPGEMEPPRGLWEGIESRLDASGNTRPQGERLRAATSPSLQFALAAAMIAVLIGAGLMAVTLLRGPEIPPGEPAEGAVAPVTGLPAPEGGSMDRAERVFLEAKQALKEAFNQQRGSLSPETIKRVDENLRIIGAAVNEIHLALDQDPGNRQLKRMLVAAQQREVALLRKVTQTAAMQQRW
jgi:hypothetical protein